MRYNGTFFGGYSVIFQKLQNLCLGNENPSADSNASDLSGADQLIGCSPADGEKERIGISSLTDSVNGRSS